jgi:lysophospholipase L1-like esterase
LVRHLEARCGAKVHLNNLSVGGTDTAWGITKVDDVAAFKPDLVILAFGMNDAARRSAKDYQANVDTIIARTGDRLPDVEFILVASMLGNRDWTALQHERFPEYRAALAERCGAGVALADLTTVWTGLLDAKRDWDLTGNGVNHPNDFGHRIYAQVISSLLLDEQ